jgi:hypothetical protein
MTLILPCVLMFMVGSLDARLTSRSVVLPQAVIPDIADIAPYADSDLSQYFPTPVPIKVAGIQHPYFRAAQNLPEVEISEASSP